MLNWLISIGGWSVGGVADLWRKVVSVVQVIYSYVDGWINQLVNDVSWLWNTFNSMIQAVENWVGQIETYVLNYANQLYNDVTSWVSRIVNDIYNDIGSSVKWLTDWVNRVVSFFTSWINSVTNWVISNIWNPLYNLISGALQWIGNEGAWVYYLITHPDQLSLILARYLLGTWVSLGKKYAGIAARWMVHGMMDAAGDIAGILEDFIAGIL